MDKVLEGRKAVRGTVRVPGDKSISHRAVILGAVARGTSTIRGLSTSMDVESTIGAMRKIGVTIRSRGDEMLIEGHSITGFELNRKNAPFDIDCGNSGTTARLLAGLLGGAGLQTRLTGDSSLMKRPMNRVVKPLDEIGARISTNNGYLPIEIHQGGLGSFNYRIPVASAQVKTALILASLFIQGTSVITEPVETRDHTERMLVLMDADIKKRNTLQGENIIISGRKELTPLNLIVPGDISSAVFFIASALVTPSSELLIRNVLLNRTRAHILEVFKRMGGDIEIEFIDEYPEPRGNVRVKSSDLKGIEVGGMEIPLLIDEIPALASAAVFAGGKTIVRGASELRVKESDRIKSIVEMVRKFGGEIEELDDGFVIKGRSRLSPAEINSYHDHRMAMAAAIIALNVRGRTVIKDSGCVDISFPGFFNVLDRAAVA